FPFKFSFRVVEDDGTPLVSPTFTNQLPNRSFIDEEFVHEVPLVGYPETVLSAIDLPAWLKQEGNVLRGTPPSVYNSRESSIRLTLSNGVDDGTGMPISQVVTLSVEYRWKALTSSGATSARVDHSAVWTAAEMILWGGASPTAYFRDGRRFDM